MQKLPKAGVLWDEGLVTEGAAINLNPDLNDFKVIKFTSQRPEAQNQDRNPDRNDSFAKIHHKRKIMKFSWSQMYCRLVFPVWKWQNASLRAPEGREPENLVDFDEKAV